MAVKGEAAIPVDEDLLKSSSPIRGPGDFRRGGERKTTVRRTLLGLLAAGALATPAAPPEEHAGLALRVQAGVIFVEALVNGEGPFTFILDTGASETVLTPPVAKRLGIGTVPVAAAQRKGSVRTLAVGRSVRRDLEVYVFDPPQAVPLRLNHGLDYHGLLGYSFLRHYVVTVDYRNERLTLAPADPWLRGSRPRDASVHAIPFTLRSGLIHARGTVDGMGPVTFLVDTGSAEALLLPEAARRLKLRSRTMPGRSDFGIVAVARLGLGEAMAENVTAVVGHLESAERAGLQYDGILGYPFLSRFEVTLDYPAGMLLLRPYGADKAP